MKRWSWLRVLFVLLVVAPLVAGDRAEALTRSRTAPYDVGCVGRPPCVVGSDVARKGELHSAGHVGACFFYGPPFAFPCWNDESTTTGVRVTKSVTGGITAYAKVRGVTVPPRTPLIAMSACLGAVDRLGHGYLDYGCRPIDSGKTTTVATNFENTVFDADRYILYVTLSGLPGAAVVERISYRTTSRPLPEEY